MEGFYSVYYSIATSMKEAEKGKDFFFFPF